MNNASSTYELIERYLNGELTAAEKAAFEKRMEEEPAFREEVTLHRSFQDFITDENALALRRAMAEEEARLPRSGGRILSINRRLLAVAASIVLVVSIGYYFFRPVTTARDLFDRNFAPYQMILSSRSGAGTDTLQNAAINRYQQADYERSAAAWSQLIQKDTNNMAAYFYRGICNLVLRKNQEAREDFARSSAHESSLFSQQAHWYTALSWLQEGRKKQACSYLTPYRDQEYKNEEINELLKSICP